MKFSVIDRPEPKIPEYTENTNSRTFVPWGSDNKFPNFINDLYKGSATLRAVIDGTVKFICGNGISISDEAAKWKNAVNSKGETMEDLVEMAGLDLLKFKGFAIQVIYNKMRAITDLYVLDFSRIRLSADGKKVYYAKSWSQWSSKYKEYDRFGEKLDPENLTQIFVYKGAVRTVYPMPTWEGAFRDCLAEMAASKYVLSNLTNGLAARTIITIPNTDGQLTEDEKKEVEKSIQSRFCGPDSDTKFFLYFKTDEGAEIEVKPIQVIDESSKFTNIKDSARENIFIAFRATPTLFGLPNKNNGFTQQEFFEAFKLYQKTQVQGYQKIIERCIEKIIGAAGSITILPFTLEDPETTEE